MVLDFTSCSSLSDFCSRELILPGISTIHGRMIITAWDFGLDNVEDDAVRMMLAATEVRIQ
jgi:hypothetical protein